MSVSDLRREGWYLLIFSVLSGVWFTGLIQREVRDDEYNNLLDTILGIGQDMEAAVVVVGATTYVTVGQAQCWPKSICVGVTMKDGRKDSKGRKTASVR